MAIDRMDKENIELKNKFPLQKTLDAQTKI